MSSGSHEKLIVLRGPSGAGKSTIARKILEISSRPTVLFEQDYIRQKAINGVGSSSELRKDLVIADTLTAFSHGYDVILEGIFNIDKHHDMFQKIISKHRDENYFYYMDIPFEETVRRHATRDKSLEFGEDEMQEWYGAASPSGYPGEIIIDQSRSLDQVVQLIAEKSGINTPGV